MKVIGCIPCRYASTRLPGKPLCDIAGKPMVLHIVEKARKAKNLDDVIVLTDDQRILDIVVNAGHSAAMTSSDCASGMDRIAEYMHRSAGEKNKEDIFVNIQGDEILLDPEHIDKLITDFVKKPTAEMGTLAHWVTTPEILNDPTTAKVVTNQNGSALYFSRQCIPSTQNGDLPSEALVQIGIYIYTRATLLRLLELQQTPLEKTEKLEQLRALEHGIDIGISIVDDFQSLSVDTEEDLKKARELLS